MRYESRNKKLNRQPGTVKNWIYHRGDIYLANLNPFKGSEQGGTRPVLVLSNDIGNFYSSMITIAPITSQLKKKQQPTHVLLDNVRGLSTEHMELPKRNGIYGKFAECEHNILWLWRE